MSRQCPRLATTFTRSITQLAASSQSSFRSSQFSRTFANAAATAKTKQTAPQSDTPSGLITDLSFADLEEDGLPFDHNDPIFKRVDPNNIHTRDRLNSMAEHYKWINWTRFGDHLHRSDVHFFDEEVKMVDDNLDVEADHDGLEEQAESDQHEIQIQEHARKLKRMLPFSAYIDSGSTTRVTKFGKQRSSWMFIIAGDKCGTATYGFGKGIEITDALRRAEADMINNITFLPLVESRTILYESIGKFGVCKVAMRPLPRGAGMTAGIVPRMVFECFGIEDINAKVIGRALPKHQVLACWQALTQQRGLRELSIARGSRSYKMFERGTQKPRAPPRAVLTERALEISRKLKEASELMIRMPPETMAEDMLKEDERTDRVFAQLRSQPSVDITDPNSPYDLDDVADGNEIDEDSADLYHWGAEMERPPNYVSVLPPTAPRIPQAQPSFSRSAGKK